MYFLGIDLGTSAVKLLLMDENGEVQKVVSREYPLYMPKEGWSEQEPADWWEQTKSALQEITQAVPSEEIKAVSFSGQMHGLVVLDEKDQVIRPAILWNDQRTQAECDTLNQKNLLEHVANAALTGFTAPKLLWMKNNEPDLYQRIKKIMLPKDYLAYKLSGVHATDYSDASGMLLLGVKNKKWSSYMLDLLELLPCTLPSLHESFSPIGTISPQAAAETGLSTETKVVIGGGDQAVGAVGTGTVVKNLCSLSLGTSGVVFVASDQFQVDYEPSAIHSFCHANGGYHMMGVTLAAAGSTKWWFEEILNTKEFDKEQANIDLSKPSKVFYLPYLSGERTPHNDPEARGVFYGMTMGTKREDMTRAVLEGVAFSLKDILEIVKKLGTPVQKARIIGGGAKSPLWCQLMADILDLEVERINADEGPAFGAAILAAVGYGHYPDVKSACESLIQVTDSFKPKNRLDYEEKYKVFRELYTRLKGIGSGNSR